MRSTRTYALLEVPAVVYAAIKALLERAAGECNVGTGGEIDMHGIAITKQAGSKSEGAIEIGTILSHQTGRGRIEIAIGGEVAQWDVADARKISSMLVEAIEASISDELVFKFLTQKVNLSPEKAASLLIEFRELRQGSRTAVNPS